MWDAIQYVGSGLTLVAFIVAVAAWYYRSQIEAKGRFVEAAREEDRAEVARDVLEFFHIDTGRLTKEQQFILALKQINARSRRYGQGAAIFCFVAVLLAILAGYAIYKSRLPPPIQTPNIESLVPGTSAGGQQVLQIKYTGDAALPAGVQAEVQVAVDQDFHTIWTRQRVPDWQTHQVVVGFPKPDARAGFARIRIVDTAGKLLRVSDAWQFSLDQEVSP
jgi:hypothetical protein